MTRIGVFVGSAPFPGEFSEMDAGTETPWGEASCRPLSSVREGGELVLMRRHGSDRAIAPHQINYRANVWLMDILGVDFIVGTYTVGGIDPDLSVGSLVVPEQVIDYTSGRENTFDDKRRHIEFANPYTGRIRDLLIETDAAVVGHGVYGCTQGPRLETAAEIARMARDGCTLVGMTGMPETALCRELGIDMAALCLVVNPAAGVGSSSDEIDIEALRRASVDGGRHMIDLLSSLIS